MTYEDDCYKRPEELRKLWSVLPLQRQIDFFQLKSRLPTEWHTHLFSAINDLFDSGQIVNGEFVPGELKLNTTNVLEEIFDKYGDNAASQPALLKSVFPTLKASQYYFIICSAQMFKARIQQENVATVGHFEKWETALNELPITLRSELQTKLSSLIVDRPGNADLSYLIVALMPRQQLALLRMVLDKDNHPTPLLLNLFPVVQRMAQIKLAGDPTSNADRELHNKTFDDNKAYLSDIKKYLTLDYQIFLEAAFPSLLSEDILSDKRTQVENLLKEHPHVRKLKQLHFDLTNKIELPESPFIRANLAVFYRLNDIVAHRYSLYQLAESVDARIANAFTVDPPSGYR